MVKHVIKSQRRQTFRNGGSINKKRRKTCITRAWKITTMHVIYRKFEMKSYYLKIITMLYIFRKADMQKVLSEIKLSHFL